MSDLNEALRQFENTEANLIKLERLWAKICKLIPDGVAFGEDGEHEATCRIFREILKAMPGIDNFTIEDRLLDYNAIGQMRFDAMEMGEIGCRVGVEDAVYEQGRFLDEYRFKLERARRGLVRSAADNIVVEIESVLAELQEMIDMDIPSDKVDTAEWDVLKQQFTQLDVLLGGLKRPSRWGDMQRHLGFGEMHDLRDIVEFDWPEIKDGLAGVLLGEDDPIPVQAEDLSHLVKSKPKGEVLAQLAWSRLSDEDFERLVFALISSTHGYENPLWLTKTNAPDRGRDLSVDRVIKDNLVGTLRHRVIIQCKHWQTKSIGPAEIGASMTQMTLWEPPRVDVLAVVTSGRFTTDAVDLIERHNRGDSALRIEMWADSHVEMLLAKRPELIAEFQLRQ